MSMEYGGKYEYCRVVSLESVYICNNVFLCYKTEYFSFQNNPKNLDLCYKMDLDLWDCLGRVKLIL